MNKLMTKNIKRAALLFASILAAFAFAGVAYADDDKDKKDDVDAAEKILKDWNDTYKDKLSPEKTAELLNDALKNSNSSESKKWGWPVYIGIGFLVVVFIGGLVWFFMLRNKEEDQE